jgi:hypothetical protein
MPTIITRTWFCKKCFDAGRPHSMHPYLVYGSSHNDYLVKIARGSGTPGYTPHILRIHKSTPSHIVFDYFCGVCGVTLYEVEEYENCWDFKITTRTWNRDIIKISDWNHWMLYKWDLDYAI